MARMLGRILSASLERFQEVPAYDAIVPIPLHQKRLLQRGFNQAMLLAYFAFPDPSRIRCRWLKRIRSTDPQTELPLAQRIDNMKDAFEASPDVEGKQILLVDDVITTGATLNAAARCLKESGAASVNTVVLARRMISNKGGIHS
ncbi:MAG: ComF family protein [SAR324 cluster bacterium]|nr:ComF family protein [SAR324 cluster bacterium]